MNVVDTSGWIEFFIASPAGEHYQAVIIDTATLLVPALSLYEIHRYFSSKITSTELATVLDVVRQAQVIPLTDERAIAASKVAQQHKLAMADAIMYATALEFNATFWTQDIDYAGLPSV